MKLVPLSSSFSAAPQITRDEIPAIAEAGFRGIVNARPDLEDLAQ